MKPHSEPCCSYNWNMEYTHQCSTVDTQKIDSIVCTYQKLQCYTEGPKNQNLALPQTRTRINFAMAFVYDDEWICDRYSSSSDENHFDVCKSRDELDMQFEDEQKQNMKSKSLVHDVHELSCSVR